MRRSSWVWVSVLSVVSMIFTFGVFLCLAMSNGAFLFLGLVPRLARGLDPTEVPIAVGLAIVSAVPAVLCALASAMICLRARKPQALLLPIIAIVIGMAAGVSILQVNEGSCPDYYPFEQCQQAYPPR